MNVFKSGMLVGGKEYSPQRVDISGAATVYLVYSGEQLSECTHSHREAKRCYDKLKVARLVKREGVRCVTVAQKEERSQLFRFDARAHLVRTK